MEVRVNPERVSQGLVGEDGSAGDGPGGRGGVELGDQREDEPGYLTEEALIVSEEHPQGLWQREDEPYGGAPAIRSAARCRAKGPLHRLPVRQGKE